MYLFMFMTILPLIILFFLMSINYFLSKKNLMDREKPTPFECGFNPMTSTRLPFSINFFIIMIIFLIFDIEIIILIPLIPSLNLNINLFSWMNSTLLILMILFYGLIYEWNEQSTIWIF